MLRSFTPPRPSAARERVAGRAFVPGRTSGTPARARLPVRVLCRVLVPARTVRLRSLSGCRDPPGGSALHVDDVSDRLKMGGVHARRLSAHVVTLQAGLDGALDRLVHDPVRLLHNLPDTDVPVPSAIARAVPLPTRRVRVKSDLVRHRCRDRHPCPEPLDFSERAKQINDVRLVLDRGRGECGSKRPFLGVIGRNVVERRHGGRRHSSRTSGVRCRSRHRWTSRRPQHVGTGAARSVSISSGPGQRFVFTCTSATPCGATATRSHAPSEPPERVTA